MSLGTASHRLRKSILFSLLEELKRNFCFQCREEISSIDELSIEHKIPYLDSKVPKELFFDLNNIAYSHLSCNIKAARKKTGVTHPSQESYRRGCRCKECKVFQKNRARKYRLSKKVA